MILFTRRVSSKLWTVYEMVCTGLHVTVTQTLYIRHLLLLSRFGAPSIKLCTIAYYCFFHSHAQIVNFTDTTGTGTEQEYNICLAITPHNCMSCFHSDTSIAELVKERTDKESFMDSLQTQQGKPI